MKFIIAVLGLTSTVALGAEQYKCVSERGDLATLVRYKSSIFPARKDLFQMNIDESLSSRYLGPMQNRLVSLKTSATSDILSDKDEISTVTLTMDKGFLTSEYGTKSEATLEVQFNGFCQDIETNTLTCRVVR